METNQGETQRRITEVTYQLWLQNRLLQCNNTSPEKNPYLAVHPKIHSTLCAAIHECVRVYYHEGALQGNEAEVQERR